MAGRCSGPGGTLVTRRFGLVLLLAALVVLLLVYPLLSGFFADWWWFQEIGFRVVFTRELVTRSFLFMLAGGLTAVLLYLNARIAQRGSATRPLVLQLGQAGPPLNLLVAIRRLTL